MKETDYAYACAYTRTLENKLLRAADFEILLRAPSYEDAQRYLAEKQYDMDYAALWREALAVCPEGAPVNLLLYQNDFHNLKVVLKALFSGTDYAPMMLAPYTISPAELHRAIAGGKPEQLPEPFKAPAMQAYQILAQKNDGQQAETALDHAQLAALREIALRDGDAFLTGWVDLLTGIAERKSARRSAMEQNSTAAFEKACDNELIRHLRQARCLTFGFGPVLGFCLGKKFELQAVRLILSGLRCGMQAQHIRERLCESYA